MSSKYTVAEFAKIKGVSRQAIYKQKNGKLKDRCVEVNGVTFILSDDSDSTTDNQPVNRESTTDNQPVNPNLPLRGNTQEQTTADNQPVNHTQPKDNQPVNQEPTNQSLNRIIDILENQLKEKDKQIAEKDKQILALTERLKENNFIQSQNKIQMIESNTSETAKRKERRGIFARFRKERLHADDTETM